MHSTDASRFNVLAASCSCVTASGVFKAVSKLLDTGYWANFALANVAGCAEQHQCLLVATGRHVQSRATSSNRLTPRTVRFQDYLCPGCSAHKLLIYRDPGHLARTEAASISV